MLSCDVCDTKYDSREAALKHKVATRHCVCQLCSRILACQDGVRAHHTAVHDQGCPQCTDRFTDRETLFRHQKTENHCFCADCNIPFRSASKLSSHLNKGQHATEFRCCDCDREFKSPGALNQHLTDKIHRQSGEKKKKKKKKQKQSGVQSQVHPTAGTQVSTENPPEPHFGCKECSRAFKTAKALKTHSASLRHKPLAKLSCPMGGSCKKFNFPSPSALLGHLESGQCSSGMNLDKLRSIIIQHDTERLITSAPDKVQDLLVQVNKQLLSSVAPTESGMSTPTDSDAGAPILTPATGRTPSSIYAGGKIWTPTEGSDLEWAMLLSQSLEPSNRCPFCPPGRLPFDTVGALQSHLRSPVHAEPFVFCPVDLKAAAGKAVSLEEGARVRAFKTLSGLAQHLESAACVGGMETFQQLFGKLEIQLMSLSLNAAPTASSGGLIGWEQGQIEEKSVEEI